MIPRRKTVLATLLALLWLGVLAWGLWWYQARYIRPFEPRDALFSAAGLRLPAGLVGQGEVRPSGQGTGPSGDGLGGGIGHHQPRLRRHQPADEHVRPSVGVEHRDP